MVTKVCFLLLVACLQLQARTYSQSITLKASNIPLEKAFHNIEQQSGFVVLYNFEELKLAKPVTISVKDMEITQVLDLLFAEQPFTYTLEDKTILVSKGKRKPHVRLFSEETVIEQHVLSGSVKDENGNSLEGVTVSIKGTSAITTTNASGYYQLTNPNEGGTLVFSMLGFNGEERPIGGHREVNVIMVLAISGLDEVVVVGYGVQKRASVTGAVSTVKSDELTVAPVASVSNALAGRLPGLISKQESGAPGQDGATLRIRGFGSALVIIDGVEGDLNLIAPNEIESISILKDASAAIYGSRAGNGVVLVTTKRGKVVAPTFTYNSTYSTQTNTQFLKPVNSAQFAEMEVEKWMHQGGLSTGAAPPFTADDIERFKAGNDPKFPNTNWFETTLRDGSPMSDNNLSLTGGNDHVKYYGYLGYLNQQAFFKSDDGRFQRYNVRSNVDIKINKNLKATVDVSAISKVRKFPWRASSGNAEYFFDLWESKPIYPAILPDPTKYGYSGTSVNVLAVSSRDGQGYRDNLNQRYNGSASLEYTFDQHFLKGLSAKAFVSYIKNYAQEKSYERPYSTYTYNTEAQTYEVKGGSETSKLNEANNISSVSNGQFSISYQKSLNDHRFKILLLSEFNDYLDSYLTAGRTDFQISQLDYLFGGSELGMSNSGSASEMGRYSYVGWMNYDYKGKYLLDFTLRRDASALFSEESRWGTFPSLSLAWRASEESFIKSNFRFLANLKLRASISQTGDDNVGSFPYISGYTFWADYPIGNQQQKTLRETAMANPDLTWERMVLKNIGLDFSMWKDKLYGEFDVFMRDRKGIPGVRTGSISYTFGASLPLENLNRQRTKGFEVNIGTKSQVGKVHLNVSANISYARTKWTYFDEPAYTDPDDIRINKRTGAYTDRAIAYQTDGLFTSLGEIYALDYNQDGVGNMLLSPGDIKIVDSNNDGIINWRDVKQVGNGVVPNWMGGLNFTASYKGFDLSTLFQGGFGFVVYNQMYIASVASTLAYEARWSENHNNKGAIAPRYGSMANTNGYDSDYWIKSGSYVRLKALSIGYSLPTKLINTIGINNLRLYGAGTNLFTFDGVSKYGVDPEVTTGTARSDGSGGIKRNGTYYPQQRTFTLGLNLTL